MGTRPIDERLLNEAVGALANAQGVRTDAARALGLPRSTFNDRIDSAARAGIKAPDYTKSPQPKGRIETVIEDGTVVVFSDAHYWPGKASTAHRALLGFLRHYSPKIVVCNGDAVDGASISRHPPIGWESVPTVEEELLVCRARLGQIMEASEDAEHYWTLGNHDARFETKLATVAKEFKGINGIHLKDHFPGWDAGWSVWLNDDIVIKHRWKGGVHAPHNNAVGSGRSIVTGHLHSAKVTPYTDYNGTRYGVDTGCLADIYHDAFQDYVEDGPRNWRSGFCVLTFKDGYMLQPELLMTVKEGLVQFRGELLEV